MSEIAKLLGIDTETPSIRLAREMVKGDRVFLDQLVELRREKMTQREMAELLGVSQSAVSQWESGDRDPRLSSIRAYALALGVSYEHRLMFPDREARCVESGIVVVPAESQSSVSKDVRRAALLHHQDRHAAEGRLSSILRHRPSGPNRYAGVTVEVAGRDERVVAP